mmetsp:Transcript_26402/g.66621  ORF Transcript_26402/g.66621 Transcript_26402/m.66621 type:complete len:321 (-) Transcript_26402:792-1754(-)
MEILFCLLPISFSPSDLNAVVVHHRTNILHCPFTSVCVPPEVQFARVPRVAAVVSVHLRVFQAALFHRVQLQLPPLPGCVRLGDDFSLLLERGQPPRHGPIGAGKAVMREIGHQIGRPPSLHLLVRGKHVVCREGFVDVGPVVVVFVVEFLLLVPKHRGGTSIVALFLVQLVEVIVLVHHRRTVLRHLQPCQLAVDSQTLLLHLDCPIEVHLRTSVELDSGFAVVCPEVGESGSVPPVLHVCAPCAVPLRGFVDAGVARRLPPRQLHRVWDHLWRDFRLPDRVHEVLPVEKGGGGPEVGRPLLGALLLRGSPPGSWRRST